MSEVSMPRLSDTMQEGTIARWLKQPGDAIKKGDVLAEIETDKATMDLESFDAGTLEKILVQEGETVPIGQAVAIIGSGAGAGQQKQAATQSTSSANGDRQADVAVQQQQKEPKTAATSDTADTQAPTTPESATGRQRESAATEDRGDKKGAVTTGDDDGRLIKSSPLARRMAEERNVDLRQVKGTGPGGRIVRDDIQDFLEQRPAPTPTPAPASTAPAPTAQPATKEAPTSAVQASASQDVEVVALSRMQAIVARRLSESKQTIPHFYVSSEIDMTDLLVMRQTFNASAGEEGVKVSVNDLIVKACALALEKFPEVNSSYKDGQFIRHKRIHVGFAVDIPAGLVVPVVRDANIKGVRSIAREAKALIERARANKLSTADLDGGTFSVSNLGMMDVTDFVAVINPPQAAILAVASTHKRYVPIDGQPVARDLMGVTMSSDHRILYGATVARFLQEVKRLLQSPYSLLG